MTDPDPTTDPTSDPPPTTYQLRSVFVEDLLPGDRYHGDDSGQEMAMEDPTVWYWEVRASIQFEHLQVCTPNTFVPIRWWDGAIDDREFPVQHRLTIRRPL